MKTLAAAVMSLALLSPVCARATEAITHVAFHAGWPNAVTAIAIAKVVFQKN